MELLTFRCIITSSKGNIFRGGFPAQRPVTRSFDVFIDLRLNKHGWENNCDVGDLKRHYVHYDVSVGVQAAIVL